ncbi:MAG: hypothetical protein QOD66_106 [Solirubrobacteraceae bacterium]|jgi:hypothetical protein|nr:hypothetical protein [Solirubrobacteraceae bacterium]
MSYTNADARAQLVSELDRAAERIGYALASLGEAYEWLDEQTADRLEEELFRPVGAAYGRAKRTSAEFSERYDLPAHGLQQTPPGGRPGDARGAIERAAEALRSADETLATLQDSMLPVEVGDPEVRAGLMQIRESIGPLSGRARELLRVLGR